MKVLIDGVEIKTVQTGLNIFGDLVSISRGAAFEYVYSSVNQGFDEYFANIGSKVEILDSNKILFKGIVEEISYIQEKNLIQIKAKDSLSLILRTLIKGRYSGSPLEIISKILRLFNLNINFNLSLQSQILHIVSYGRLSGMDIILAVLYRAFGNSLKLYIDKNSTFKFLLPYTQKPASALEYGKHIISSSNKADMNGETSTISVIGADDFIISGQVVKLVDNNRNKSAEFVVENDTHTFGSIHLTTLSLKERSAFYV